MEIPLAIIILAGVLLYGAVFCMVAIKKGATDSFTAEDDAPMLESQPQLIQKKNPQAVEGQMSRRAEYSSDNRFGGNKVITLPFGAEPVEQSRQAQNDQ